jgi:hypothetical protein
VVSQKLSFVPARLRELIAFTKNGSADIEHCFPRNLDVLTLLNVPLSMHTPAVTREIAICGPPASYLPVYRAVLPRELGQDTSVFLELKCPVLSELFEYCVRFASFSRSSESPLLIESYFASTSIFLCNLD